MTDSLVPEWIKQIKREQDEQKATAKQNAQQTALAAKTIQADGPVFWTQLLKELQITVDSLPLIGIRANLSDLRSQAELSCRIEMSRESTFPDYTYVNLFYVPSGPVIRCHPSDAAAFNLQLGVHGDQLMAYDGSVPLSPPEAAKYITESMFERLRGA